MKVTQLQPVTQWATFCETEASYWESEQLDIHDLGEKGFPFFWFSEFYFIFFLFSSLAFFAQPVEYRWNSNVLDQADQKQAHSL